MRYPDYIPARLIVPRYRVRDVAHILWQADHDPIRNPSPWHVDHHYFRSIWPVLGPALIRSLKLRASQAKDLDGTARRTTGATWLEARRVAML